ncbi:nuclear receptor NHR-34 [Aphelenchoides avenae]|nr:nuclear receptor NHR-34 [Aphelenchus avenae]
MPHATTEAGCKGFFRRTVRGSRTYECHYEKKCTIQKEYRNCCRACRYIRCLKAGLDPKLVCADRGPIKKRSEDIPDLPSDSLEPPTPARADTSPASCTPGTSSMALFRPSAFRPTKVEPFETSGALARANCIRIPELDELPLGAKRIIRLFENSDAAAIAQYFVSAERLCDVYGDPSLDPTTTQLGSKYNVNVPASEALRRPGAICPRIPADWRPLKVASVKNFTHDYLRTIAHFFDWASHLPEMERLSDGDKVWKLIFFMPGYEKFQELLITGRLVPCTWLLMCHRSAIQNANGIVITAGEYLPANGYHKMEPEIRPLHVVADAAMSDLVEPFQELSISEAEYAFLRVICLCQPVPKMSPEGTELIRKAKDKYLGVLSEIVRKTGGDDALDKIIQRIGRIMLLLPAAERVAQLDDATLSMMSLFNYAGFQGNLTWDIHVKKSSH